MPRFVDAIRMVSGTTDLPVATTDGKLFGVGSAPSTVAFTFVDTTTAQTLEAKTLGQNCRDYMAAGSSTANLPNYGISVLTGTSTAAITCKLAAPSSGVHKVIYCAMANATETVTVFSGSSAITFGADKHNVVFSTQGVVELLGISSTQWAVLNVGTTLLHGALPSFTTSAT